MLTSVRYPEFPASAFIEVTGAESPGPRFLAFKDELKLDRSQWPVSFTAPGIGNGQPFRLVMVLENSATYRQRFSTVGVTIYQE